MIKIIYLIIVYLKITFENIISIIGINLESISIKSQYLLKNTKLKTKRK